MLIYVHVPFCRRKCRYCAFHSEPLFSGPRDDSANRLRIYTDNLFFEIAQWGDRLGKQEVNSIFFGGGTPSLLPAQTVNAILNRLNRAFNVHPKAEITMEANPESLKSRGIAYEFLRAGINRVSLGVQSLDNGTLEFLGRAHNAKDALHAYYCLREAGCANISLDMMWGLPGQGVRQWLRQLDEIIRLRPEHISCYNLTLEEGTPVEADCANSILTMPTEREQAGMFMQGSERLEETGLVQYEISNFARMGFQCRHNTGYWEGEDYMGFGPSATSTIAGTRYVNSSIHAAWARRVQQELPSADAQTLDPVSRVLELIMLRLRTTRGLRVKAYTDLTGRSFFKDHQKLVHALHKNGLIRLVNGYMRLTRNGMLVSNSILATLFDTSKTLLAELPQNENSPAIDTIQEQHAAVQ
jgi:oxygen-independent coproporphyrinogen-3 oxidase